MNQVHSNPSNSSKLMKTEPSSTDAKPNHHSDAIGVFPIDPKRRTRLGRVENARTAKFNRSNVDVHGLAAELRRNVRGEVRFDNGSRALYATDGSNYRQVPIGVVIPRDVDDIVATVAAARHYGAPVLARGGGRHAPARRRTHGKRNVVARAVRTAF